jgi:hypothetical protein
VALSAYYQESRELALLLLKEKLKDPATDVVAAHNQLKSRVTALTTETDNNKLLALALTGEFDVLRVAATDRLRDPVVLEQVALRADARDVLKAVLAKLEDKAILNRLASNAANLPMRLAAAQKAGSKSWEEIFAAATARGISEKEKTILNQLGADSDDFPRLQEAAQMAGFKSWQEFIAAAPSQDASVQMLGDALAAVSLFPAVQPEAQTGVQQACLNLIRRGDESRIPEMVDLLEGYGDKTLAEDYLNCGQPDLDTAGQAWASKRDYDIGKGSGSSRARWGSGM